MNQTCQFTWNCFITKRSLFGNFSLYSTPKSLLKIKRNYSEKYIPISYFQQQQKDRIPREVCDLFAEHNQSLRCIKEALNKFI